MYLACTVSCYFQIGLATCQIARSLGAFIVGTAGTEQGMKLILSNGAHLAFNHRDEGYIDKIKVQCWHILLQVYTKLISLPLTHFLLFYYYYFPPFSDELYTIIFLNCVGLSLEYIQRVFGQIDLLTILTLV